MQPYMANEETRHSFQENEEAAQNVTCYIYLEVTDSTNNELKRRLRSGEIPRPFTVVSAGMQTAGRGRSGHEWVSPSGVSVSTSMIFYPGWMKEEALPETKIPGITILAAMAVAKTVESLFGLPAQIKWPNDILIAKRKICGILTERVGGAIIVGIGLNVRRGSYPDALSDRATSIEEELAAEPGERAEEDFSGLMDVGSKDTVSHPELPGSITIIETIWNYFRELYEEFRQERSLSFLLEDYNRRLLNKNNLVRILDPQGHFEAKALGMDEAGRLVVVDTDTGQKSRIDSGEVQVRGLDGYV